MSLLKKYRGASAPVRASFWFLICGFMQKAVAMLTTPLFTRIMTEEAYGEYGAFHSWSQILTVLVSLNLAAGVYTKGMIKHEDDQGGFTSSMLGLSTVAIATGFLAYLIFHPWLNGLMGLSTPLGVAMFVEIWAVAVYHFWSSRERVNYKYVKLIIVTAVYVLATPGLGLLGVLLADEEHQMHGRIYGMTLAAVVMFAVLFILMMVEGKRFFDKKYWIYALKFNLPLVPHYLSQIVLNQSDRLMIKEMIGAPEAAYYSVAYSVAVILQVLNSAISGSMNPWIYRKIKAGQARDVAKVSYMIIAGIALLNVLLIAAAPEIMMLMAPASYGAAVWIIPPVTASVFFTFLYNLFATFEYYYEKTNFIMIASVSGAALNILLNAIFIPLCGFVAAGYTTLVCYIVYAFAHYLFMRRINKRCMGGERVYNPWIIIGIGGALVVLSALMMLLYELPIVRYIIIASVCVVGVIFSKRIIKLLRRLFGGMREKQG